MSRYGRSLDRPVLARPDRISFFFYPIAFAASLAAVLVALGAITEVWGDRSTALAMALCAGGFGVVGSVGLSRLPRPRATRAPAVFSMATIGWTSMMVASAIVHLSCEATSSIDTSIFEGMATVTTTAMTTVTPEELPDGLLLLRVLTQWVAGFGALVLGLVVIPLVSGVNDMQRAQGTDSFNPARSGGVIRILRIYLGFTAAMVLAYVAAGMGLFDGVAHSLTTVSTGGLSTKNASIAAFDSGAIEWVATVGMLVAGLNIMVVWWVLRGNFKSLFSDVELRGYIGAVVFTAAALAAWFGDDLGSTHGIRTAAFTVASAASTTGLLTVPWRVFDNGAQALVLILVGIGAMAGSAGGGFRYLRVIEAARFARRELVRQLHPNSVRLVKVGGRVIEERVLERLHGHIVMFIITAAFGAVAVAAFDSTVGPTAALSMALSALATAGPTIGEAGSPVVGDLGSVSHLVLAALMLLGRLSIYPVLLTLMTFAERGRESMGEARSQREARGPVSRS